ncbi:MAG: hypothetical protein AAGI69_30665 [Cyanobacteria bacterium P01_H01_bin.21]
MPDKPEFKAKNLLSKPTKKYSRNSWIGLGVVLALGGIVIVYGIYEDRQAQTNAYESAQRNVTYAKTLENSQRRNNF